MKLRSLPFGVFGLQNRFRISGVSFIKKVFRTIQFILDLSTGTLQCGSDLLLNRRLCFFVFNK